MTRGPEGFANGYDELHVLDVANTLSGRLSTILALI